MAKFKRSLRNARGYKEFTNNPKDLFDHSMSNLFDNFYSRALDISIDGEFKAVCLSGIEGGNNSSLVTDKYMNIIVRPLAYFGSMLPDPRDLSTADEVNKSILLHRSAFLAKSDYQFNDHTPILFGQIVNCYYEKGSIKNSTFRGLRFKEPEGMDIEQSYLQLANIEGVVSGPKAFQPGLFNHQNMGDLGGAGGGSVDNPWGLKPKRGIYNGRFLPAGTEVENGYPRFGSNLLQVPDERFWELKGGGTGAILKDFIDSFNRMCEHFHRDFGKKFLCSGIRDFKTQIAVRKRSVNRGGCPSMTVSGCSTAVPGSSNHGWGQAVDIKSVTRRTKLTWKDPEFKWLQTHAGTYGWIHPSWAQKGGSMPEPWHWEPANKVITLIK